MTSQKVLVLTSTFPRWEEDTEPAFIETLSLLLSTNHKIHVLAPHTKNSSLLEKKEGLTIHRFRYAPEKWQKLAYEGGISSKLLSNKLYALLVPLFILGELIAAIKLQRRHHFDIIHAHWIIPQGFAAVLVKILTLSRKPQVIVTSHGGDLYSLQNKFLIKLKKWIMNSSDHITVVSQAMREYCRELGVNKNKISVYPMGVDLIELFTPPSPSDERKGLIFVGRLVEKKGVQSLLYALKLIEDDSLQLEIIGDGPLKKHLEKLTKTLNLEKQVTFLGALQNSLIPKKLRKAAIAIVPSIIESNGDQEGLGLTIIEALGCECAVIASELPAIKDIITHNKNGYLVTPNNPLELAEHINDLLQTPSKRLNLGKKGRAYCLEKFSWDICANNYHNLYANFEK
ncbi:glycosyltransferase [Dasania marina]|uniref:glycosyltransferase n=1 Tax=Dasania marina TaxID=471499 RepID=UPI0030D8918B|tara:strand:- start:59507 stop:60703 length:1197 start_codon:yes stop_codon:yes gene_type:complete